MADGGVMVDIKPEIKVDPASNGDNVMDDLEEFEDDTDLHIPAPGGQAWLVKLDSEMWQAWNGIYRDQPENTRIQIGTMRVYQPKEGEPQDTLKQRIEIELDKSIPQHSDLTKTWNLRLTTPGYANTVVFAEKDLPGHKSQAYGRGRYQTQRPTGVPSKEQRYGGGRPDAKPGYRTAIPKQTFLSPMIAHEAFAAPKEDDDYLERIRNKLQASIAPSRGTLFAEGVDRSMHPGVSNLNAFTTFGLSAKTGVKGSRKPPPREKAVRMSEAALIDALQQCFRRYTYWSLKALRNDLKQPEQFIKSVLENIATLVRSGDYASTYKLKPEYADIVKADDNVKEEAATVESGTDMGTGDELGDDADDDDAGDFEDVRMEGGE